jgi:BTB/POZ domain
MLGNAEISECESQSRCLSNFFFEHDPMVVFLVSGSFSVITCATSRLGLISCVRLMQIGKRLYRVHKYFLVRESSFFRDMFSLPQGDLSLSGVAPVEGHSVEHPIVLAETTELEFDSILEFLYFGCVLYAGTNSPEMLMMSVHRL